LRIYKCIEGNEMKRLLYTLTLTGAGLLLFRDAAAIALR
jgi:hypothetical protein